MYTHFPDNYWSIGGLKLYMIESGFSISLRIYLVILRKYYLDQKLHQVNLNQFEEVEKPIHETP